MSNEKTGQAEPVKPDEPVEPVDEQGGRTATKHSWRGVGPAQDDEVSPQQANLLLRRRSRALLGDLLSPHKRAIGLLIMLIVVSNGARLSIPFLVGVGIDRGIPPMRDGEGPATLVTIVLVILAAAITQAFTKMAFLRLSGRIGQDVLLEIRRRVFNHFQKLSLSFHEKYTSGRVISRLTSDVDAIYEMLQNGFDSMVTAVLTLIGTAILLLALDLELGLVAMIPLPILWLLTTWFRKESQLAYRRTRETVAVLIVQFVESMTGMRAVQAFRREPRNQQIYGGLNEDYRLANQRAMRLLAVFTPTVKLIGNLSIGVILMYGGWLAVHGQVTVGVVASFLLYLRQFYQPMEEISQFYNQFQSASAALEKLSGVLAEQPAVAEPVEPTDLPRPRGEVRFANVTFGYSSESRDPEAETALRRAESRGDVSGAMADESGPETTLVLPELDLRIPAGQTIALVGATGAGKTTLAKLLSRFYDPLDGSVQLDGVPLTELDEYTLRKAIVMVTQENFLFTGSVAENIRFGRPDASMHEIVAASRAVGAHEFVSELPQQYETSVGKRGGRLSAGQRQLIAFARAFLADPAVLILDEATSSLDVPSERSVQRALRTVLAERTALIIAHRLSTVEIADRVLVMENGRVVEDGPPEQLIGQAGGRFAGLHQAWLDSLA